METLILFSGTPAHGRAKTRLAADRGDDVALALAWAFIKDTAKTCAEWRATRSAADFNRKVVFYVDAVDDDGVMAGLAERAGARIEQWKGDDIGARIDNAFAAEFDLGARAVAAIGGDSPTLPAYLVDHAFRALQFERVVLGPTFDGGYWLVGAQRPAPTVLAGLPWHTSSVMRLTIDRLRAVGVEPHLLPFWYDVDEGADLDRLVWHCRALRAGNADVVDHTWQALTVAGLASNSTPLSET